MTAAYVPQVGDRIRLQHWVHDWIDVKYVSRELVIGVDGYGNERMPWLSEPWVKAVEPLPERWSNVYPDGFWQSHETAISARRNGHVGRIAVLHIWTDTDGNDHAEIERVAL